MTVAAAVKNDTDKTVKLRRIGVAALVVVVAIAGLVCTAFVVAERLEPDAALAAAGIGLVSFCTLGLVILHPSDLARFSGRIKSVTLGQLGVEMADYKSLAKQEANSEDTESSGGSDESLLGIRLKLEYKLTYLAKHVLATDPGPRKPIPTFLTIGSLLKDGLLDDDQARIAEDILTMRKFEFDQLSKEERDVFLLGADKFANSVRAEVFSAHLRKTLKAAGWICLRPFGASSRRRDLLVQAVDVTNHVQHHVIPVFATKAESKILTQPCRRLENRPRARAGGKRLIVVPPLSKAARVPGQYDKIGIVTPKQLMQEIGRGKPVT